MDFRRMGHESAVIFQAEHDPSLLAEFTGALAPLTGHLAFCFLRRHYAPLLAPLDEAARVEALALMEQAVLEAIRK
jgi:hypothetical protein